MPGSGGTNLTLVNGAEAIVIGRVSTSYSFVRVQDRFFREAYLAIDPIVTLKGNGPKVRFALEDSFALSDPYPGDPKWFSEPSDPMEMSSPHRQALAGGCVRSQFVLGQIVVLFLERYGGKWRLSGPAFSRAAEDIPTLDAPWFRLVRLYGRTLGLPIKSRTAYLLQQRNLLQKTAGVRSSAVIAEDIGKQLRDRKNRFLLYH